MKKLILCLLLAVLFSNCSKQKEDITDLTKEVLEQKTVSTMRLAYGFLSVNEKSDLWLNKLNAVLYNDKSKLSNRQKEIVLEIKAMLENNTMANLIKNPSIGEDFLNNKLENYKKYFKSQELYLLIENPYYESDFSIFKAEEYLTKLQNSNLVTPPINGNCTCYYNIGCGLNGYCNWKTKCTLIAECGLFGTSNCKGKCD